MAVVRAGRWLALNVVTVALLLGVASSAFAQTATVTAAWDANSDGITAGYMVYYGSSSGSYEWSYDAGNQTTAQLTLTRGANYYFAVRGYNTSAQLGPASTEAMFALESTVTAPTAAITATMQNATTALVSWQTTNAVSATVNGVSVGLTGSQSVPVSATTTFTVVATSASGQTVSRSATVTVAASAPTASITASMHNASTALVTWQTANATSATVNGTSVGLSGSASVPVSATTTFTIVATNAAGQTATGSATVTVAAPAPVPAPDAEIAATLSGNTALVTWNTANATSATINGVSVGLSGSTSVAVSVTTTFTIVATNATGQTITRSATVTVAAAPPPASAVPDAPSGLQTAVNRSRVSFSWRAPSSGATPDGYLIDVGVSGSSKMIASAYPVGNVVSVSADLPNGRYWTRVRARNSVGIGPYSNLASFRVGKSVVSPQGFTVQWVGSTAILTWTVPAADGSVEDMPTGFVLEAGTAPGLSDVATVRLGNVNSLSVPIPAGVYYVRLRAANGEGDSDPTPDLVLVPPGAPQQPTSFMVSRVNATAFLRWTAPSSGVTTGYVIEVGSAPGLSDITKVELGHVTQFSAPAPAGTYYLRVRAKNALGAGAPSNEAVLQ